jgi:hypothetical protein
MKRNYNPTKELNERKYINEVSLKYRYDLMEIKKMNKPGSAEKNEKNLFDRMTVVNTLNIDRDIEKNSRELAARKQAKLRNLSLANITEIQKRKSSVTEDVKTNAPEYLSPLENINDLSNINKTILNESHWTQSSYKKKQTIRKSATFKLDQSPLSILKCERLPSSNHRPITSPKSKKVEFVNPLQKRRKFSTYFNSSIFGIDDMLNNINHGSLLYSVNKKEMVDQFTKIHSREKKKKYGRLKHHHKRGAVFQMNSANNSPNISAFSILDNEFNEDKIYNSGKFEEEYDQIKYDNNGSIQLIKNYLVPPELRKAKKIQTENMILSNPMKTRGRNGKSQIALSRIFSKEDSPHKNIKFSISSSKNVIYALMRSDQNGGSKNGSRRSSQIKLPQIHQTHKHIEAQKEEEEARLERINAIKNRNREQVEQNKERIKDKFAKGIFGQKTKMNRIDSQIKNILQSAAMNVINDNLNKKKVQIMVSNIDY